MEILVGIGILAILIALAIIQLTVWDNQFWDWEDVGLPPAKPVNREEARPLQHEPLAKHRGSRSSTLNKSI
jgi:hypothetical protein